MFESHGDERIIGEIQTFAGVDVHPDELTSNRDKRGTVTQVTLQGRMSTTKGRRKKESTSGKMSGCGSSGGHDKEDREEKREKMEDRQRGTKMIMRWNGTPEASIS